MQPLDADRLSVVQVDRDRLDRLAERRSGLKTGRRRGDGALAAASATSAEQPHPGYVRLDRWQFDAVIDVLRRLRLGRPGGGTMRAGVEQTINDAVGIGLQRAADAGTALAWRLVAV